MKTIIAGSRGITNYRTVVEAVEASGFVITEVVSGGARGVDQLGERYAILNHVELTTMPAEWNTYGRSAGQRRNIQMADYAEALIAVWDGESRGTKHMIDAAGARGLKVYVHRVTKESEGK